MTFDDAESWFLLRRKETSSFGLREDDDEDEARAEGRAEESFLADEWCFFGCIMDVAG